MLYYIAALVVCGATQKFGEFDHKKVTVTHCFHCLLQSNPLGHVYSDPSMFPMVSCILEVLSCKCVDNLLQFYVDLINHVKMTPFQP
jgi:hypothetical protein